MFNFLKRILGRSDAATAVLESDATAAPAAAVARPAPKASAGVEVASLSLRAILEKLPADLKAIVNQFPDDEAKIVLPVSTIMKQLASGSVKMSLASLLRQAPPGTFRKAEIEDKRMVDVPLSEVFKTVSPARLRLRADQRQYDVPTDATGLFGHNADTRSVADASVRAAAPRPGEPLPPATPPAEPVQLPITAAPATDVPKSTEPIVEDAKIASTKVLRMPGIPAVPAPAPSEGSCRPIVQSPGAVGIPKPAASAEPARLNIYGELALSFVEVASTWPEGVRSELSILSGDTKLVIPASAVAPGLQKGKVSFPWSQVRMWIRPSFHNVVSIADDFALVLPLKVVAPAFVAATGATKRREGAAVDQSLPDFFGPTATKSTKPELPLPGSVAESAPAPACALKLSIASKSAEAVDAAAQVAVAPPALIPASDPAVAAARATGLKLSIIGDAASKSEPAAPVPALRREPLTLSELFGQPDKSAWTPAELIARTCDLPGVAGAVVALEEGLVVAQKLPEGLAAETFAAFMPQFFGRIERYVEEMKLGDTNEITIHSTIGPCHIARSGKVFFAALGRTGGKLPAGLKLIPAELANHNH